MFKPCLKRKYEFLRKLVDIKRELMSYAEMEVETDELYKHSIGDMPHYTEASKVISKKFATWVLVHNYNSLDALLTGKAFEESACALADIRDEKDKWGWSEQ